MESSCSLDPNEVPPVDVLNVAIYKKSKGETGPVNLADLQVTEISLDPSTCIKMPLVKRYPSLRKLIAAKWEKSNPRKNADLSFSIFTVVGYNGCY